MAAKTFSLSVIISAIDKLSQPLIKMQSALRKFSTSTAAVGMKMTSMGKTMMSHVTLPLVALGTLATKSSYDLSQSMGSVATLLDEKLGNVYERTEQMKKGIQEMAMAGGKSTEDLANGMYQVVSAFLDTNENMDRLKVVSKAASAGMSTTTESLNLLAAVTKGYGDTSIDAMKKVSDLAFQTVKLGQTTFPELAASIGGVVPMAAKLGVKQEELFAGFAALTGVTGNASEVSTQFSGMLRALIKPTDLMQKAIKHLGYADGEAMVKQLGLVGTMKALNVLVKGNNEAWGQLTPRAEALTGIFAITGGAAKDFATKFEEMTKATGSTDEAYKRMITVAKDARVWKQLKATIAVTAQMFGQVMAPMISKVMIRIQHLLKWFQKLPKHTKEMIIKAAVFAATIGPLLLIVGKMITVISTVSKAISALKILANPWVLLIIAIIAIIGGLVYIMYKWEKNSKGITRTIEAVTNTIKNLRKWVMAVITVFNPFVALPLLIIRNWKQIKEFFKEFNVGEKFGKLLDIIGGGIKTGAGKVFEFGKGLLMKNQAEVNLNVTSDTGSTVTVTGTSTKGNGMKLKTKIGTYAGATIGAQ